jgi:cell division protein ZapB
MNHELFETLESKVGDLLAKYSALKDENILLAEENERLLAEREGLKSRVDAILGKLEGI